MAISALLAHHRNPCAPRKHCYTKAVVTAADARRCLIWLVLAFVLLTSVSPMAGALFLAILVPVWYFFGETVSIRLSYCPEDGPVALFPYYPAISSRAPPLTY